MNGQVTDATLLEKTAQNEIVGKLALITGASGGLGVHLRKKGVHTD